jgi:hypothetical protein
MFSGPGQKLSGKMNSYGVAGANRPIYEESDAYFYNLDDPTIGEKESKPPIITPHSKGGPSR